MGLQRGGLVVAVIAEAIAACSDPQGVSTEWHVHTTNRAMHVAPNTVDELAAMSPHLTVTGADGPLHDRLRTDLAAAGFGRDGGLDVTIAMPALVSGKGSLPVDVRYKASWLSAGRHYKAEGELTGSIDYTTLDDNGRMLADENGKFLAARIYEQLDRSRPKHVSKLAPFTRVTAVGSNLHQSCSLHEDGTVRCWAGEPASRLGAIPMPIEGITNAVEIAVGDSVGCARLADHTTRCWDQITFEDGNLSSSECGLDHVKSLAQGSPYCVVKDDDSIVCWRPDALANGCKPTDRQVIPKVAPRSLATSFFQSCAIDGHGDVRCWKTCNRECTEPRVPQRIAELAGASTVTANGVVCAIIGADTVRCKPEGPGVETYKVPGVARISNGFGFGFALTSDHKLYEWDLKSGVTASPLSDVRDASAYSSGGCVVADGGASVYCRTHDHPALAKVAFSR